MDRVHLAATLNRLFAGVKPDAAENKEVGRRCDA